jgi:hypothetical protein
MIGFYWICVSQMGRVTESFRQLYEETVSDLKMKSQVALVELDTKMRLILLLKVWNLEQAAYIN